MKIVMLTRESLPFHSYGGMQRYVWCLARYLAREDIEIEFVLPPSYHNEKTEIIDNVKFTFIGPTVRKPFFWTRYLLFSLRASRYLSKQEFDILHGFEICPFFYLLKKKRKPVVVQSFGNEPLKTIGIKRTFHRLRWVPFFKSVVRNSDFVGSIGKKQTEELQQLYGISKQKIFLLPDGVELEKISQLQGRSTKARHDIGFKNGDPVLICVSRFAPNKGIQYLIQAMRILVSRSENMRLILIGSGTEEKYIDKLVKRSSLTSNIRHFKNLSDEELFQYYRLSDIFVLPTLYEGLPLVLLEAEACSLPVVTTNITDNAQVVKDWINGFLVPPKNPQAMAEAVRRIYDNRLLTKMGKASREIAENYDWARVADAALSKYNEILSTNRSEVK